MLPEIITLNKTFSRRLEEYQQLFDNIETPCSEITEIWGSVFEELAVIGVDWEAVWILSENDCKKYDLLYPSAVIVNVDDFNWQELSASVSVIAVQEDIVVPSTAEVPVIDLYPIKIQDYDETDLRDIEDWLDKCRYFLKNLWYSWDAKLEMGIMDWCEAHLVNRLKMHYDMKNGVFDKTIVNYLKLLLAEAQNINNTPEHPSLREDERLLAVKKYIRKEVIKAELDLFEEPDLRYGMVLLKKREKHFRNFEGIEDIEVKFVWMDGSSESLIYYLKMAQLMINKNAPLKVCKSFQEALDTSSTNDIIILPPGSHTLSLLRGIEDGGVIKGLDKCESVIVPDSLSITRAILFECFGYIELENLTISKPTGIVLQVFHGALKLTNCKILSKNKTSTSKGIVILSGCKLYLDHCELQGFGTAVALQADTDATLTNTKVFDCYEGIKVTENASLTLNMVQVSHCSAFAIRVVSSDVSAEIPFVGDLNLIKEKNLSCKITAQSVTFNGNVKGDVIVKKSEKAYISERSSPNVSNDVIYISDREEGST